MIYHVKSGRKNKRKKNGNNNKKKGKKTPIAFPTEIFHQNFCGSANDSFNSFIIKKKCLVP